MTRHAARGLVLTAGYGTRLRPLTYDRAKAAVPVAGVPLIRRLLRVLVNCGLRDLVLNLHHAPHTITALTGDGSEFGARLRYSFEPTLLGSAGGPRRALPLLDPQRFFIINGDTLTDMDLGAIETAHSHSGAAVTLAVMPNPAPDRYGGILAEADGRVVGFAPRGTTDATWHFVGVQMVESQVFAALPEGRPAATIPDLYQDLIDQRSGAVRIAPVQTVFHDVGTPADYLRTCLSLATAEGGPDALVGTDCAIDPTATVRHTVLWNRVRIGAGVTLAECVVGDDVTVPARSHFERRVILPAHGGARAPGERIEGALLTAPLDPRTRP